MRRRRYDYGGIFQVVSIDGEPFTNFVAGFKELAYANRDIPDLVNNVRALKIGDRIEVGGGAAASFMVQRLG